MPDDFNFSYSFDFFDKFSSFDSTYKRSYNFHDTTIRVVLSREEKQLIYAAMIENDLWQLPVDFEALNTKDMKCIYPSSTDELWVAMNGKVKKIKFDHSCSPKKDPDAVIKYSRIILEIVHIIRNKKEVQKLPSTDIMIL